MKLSKELKHEYPMGISCVENKWRQSKELRGIYRRWFDFAIKNAKINDSSNVLEIGCGPGRFASQLYKLLPNVEYTGVDYTKEIVDFAKRNNKGNKARFICSDVDKLGLPENHYDCVIFVDVLHHINLKKNLKRFQNFLKKDGLLVCVEPNPTLIKKIVCKLFGFHEDVSKYPTAKQITEQLSSAGFSVKKNRILQPSRLSSFWRLLTKGPSQKTLETSIARRYSAEKIPLAMLEIHDCCEEEMNISSAFRD
jgi:ubiquinone/menaquinone biosynthesis C-methylase UbiE